MTDCPLCKDARGINKKEKFIEHLDSHQEMAMNHDMMFRKFKEYVLAHENFTEGGFILIRLLAVLFS
jgi:hypothetical protein